MTPEHERRDSSHWAPTGAGSGSAATPAKLPAHDIPSGDIAAYDASLNQHPLTPPPSPDGLCEEYAGRLSRLLKEMRPSVAFIDLDMTLVDTSQVYTELEIATCAHFGFDDAEQVRKKHYQLQSLAGEEIMNGLFNLGRAHGAFAQTNFHDFYAHFHNLVAQLRAGTLPLKLTIEPLAGARECLEILRQEEIPAIVTTGSARPLANWFLERGSFLDYFTPNCVVCAGEHAPSKATPEFWRPLLAEHGSAIGLEDNVEAASWMLEHGVEHVFLRNWRKESSSALRELYGNRFTEVSCWRKLL
jgi:beta-phosphoglucomutase-like phosphatase (HAD superfamily)